jgi:hypothetical protein
MRFALAALPGAALFDWGKPRDCLGLISSGPECALRLSGSVEPMQVQKQPDDNQVSIEDWGRGSLMIVTVRPPGKHEISITLFDEGATERPRTVLDPTFRRLLLIYKDRAPTLVDIENRDAIGSLPGYTFAQTTSSPGGNSDALRAEFSDDGTSIITRLANQPSRVWDAADGRLRKEFPGYAEFVAATTRILSRGRSQDLWDAKTLAPIATFASALQINDSKTVGARLDDSGGFRFGI